MVRAEGAFKTPRGGREVRPASYVTTHLKKAAHDAGRAAVNNRATLVTMKL